MIKLLVMVKKRPDLTDQEFRHHYETSHAPLAREIFGDLFVEFRRNYPGVTTALAQGADEAGAAHGASVGCAYDAITEVVLGDESALQQMLDIYARPEVRRLLAEDEARFMDRDASRMGMATVCGA